MLKILVAAAALALVGAIVWAMPQADIFESFGNITEDPWVLVAIVDLYAGFVIYSAIVWTLEQNKKAALLWIVPTYFLGNVIPAAYFIFRFSKVLRTQTA